MLNASGHLSIQLRVSSVAKHDSRLVGDSQVIWAASFTAFESCVQASLHQ